MSQLPNPQPPKTPWGERTEKVMENILEPLDLISQRLLGSLWRTLYESVRDAIALSLLLQIPSLIGRLILGKEFSSYDVCLQENPLGSSRYACFIIVTSDFLLWIVLAGRILSRFWVDFKSLWKKGGTRRGSR
jgi:hypothetical protein